MPTISQVDPTGKATGVNTRVYWVQVLSTDPLGYTQVNHNLGFIPDWIRITPASVDNDGTPVPTPGNGGAAEPKCQIAAKVSLAGIVSLLDSPDGGTTIIDLTESILLTTGAGSINGGVPGLFMVEIGRTHSVPK